ncbi:MAG: metallophosphoesterase, partial [Parvibaculum sedimenti]
MRVCGAALAVLPEGAVWWEMERMLVVADLHLEKGSAFAARGIALPPYDTRATLRRLDALIAKHRPLRLVALGDSFHDQGAEARMSGEDAAMLSELTRRTEWVWIAGNHD